MRLVIEYLKKASSASMMVMLLVLMLLMMILPSTVAYSGDVMYAPPSRCP
jgi:hypothetical protein